MDSFSEILKRKRTSLSMNKREFSLFLGISKESLVKYESLGLDAHPKIDTVISIANALEIPISVLVGHVSPNIGESISKEIHDWALANDMGYRAVIKINRFLVFRNKLSPWLSEPTINLDEILETIRELQEIDELIGSTEELPIDKEREK